MSGFALIALAMIAEFRRKYGLNEEIYRQDEQKKREKQERQRAEKEKRRKMSSKTVHERMDRLGRKIAAASDDGISWHGWIRGGRKQKRELRGLGVRGLMLYTLSDAHGGIFEHCLCDTPTMERLRKEYPLFWPGTFTGCDINGDQLPREHQEYGKLVYENYDVGRDRGRR